MDISGSMHAMDVKPGRIVAAQEAAKAFTAEPPKTTQIGTVSFAATASVVQSPTHSREDLAGAIDRFSLWGGTATDLQKIYQNLNTRIFFERKETEVTTLFAAAAALLAFLSAVLSMLWFNRVM